MCIGTRVRLCDSDDCENCFLKSFASSARSKFWSSKNEKSPREVFKGSHKKYNFDCECGHLINISLKRITRGEWCSYCAKKRLCDDKNCNMCFLNSFSSNPKSNFWSKENKKVSRDVHKSSDKKYKFNCKCGHTFEKRLNSISNSNEWCPYCAHSKLCENIDCKCCYNNSFISSKYAELWSNKNNIKQREVFRFSHLKYKFNCNTCLHEYEARPHDIDEKNNGCCYCGSSKLCNKLDCVFCFKRSFASNESAKFWSTDNNIDARCVFIGTNKKYKFNCPYCKNI